MKEFLKYFWRPKFWFVVDPTHESWDKKLNELLDKYQPTEIGECTCRLGNVGIWIGNYPFAYGNPYYIYDGKGLGGKSYVLSRLESLSPSRSTKERLHKIIGKRFLEDDREIFIASVR